MVGEIGKNFHRINAASEDQQADHQCAIVEIEGTVSNHTISILIDPGATLSYISPRMVELYQLTRERNTKPWLVQLAMGEKRKVTDFIADCEVKLQDHKTKIDLKFFPLGSYDMIISMD